MLASWLAFVVLASGLPFLLFGVISEPGGHGAWVVAGGGVYRWSATPGQMAVLGEPFDTLRWEPGLGGWLGFMCGSWSVIQNHAPILIIGGPTWPFLLAPTLVVMGIARTRRLAHDRRLARMRAAGRTPCPACGYDATGLAQCPECGAGVGQPAP